MFFCGAASAQCAAIFYWAFLFAEKKTTVVFQSWQWDALKMKRGKILRLGELACTGSQSTLSKEHAGVVRWQVEKSGAKYFLKIFVRFGWRAAAIE
jgi:GR25 family glycosyltransferase involved in LPS biosynthesis